MLYITIANVDVAIPVAVLIKASEIPFANFAESGAPPVAKAENALIIPVIVPNKLTNVPIDTKVAKTFMFFSNIGISNAVVSSISFWIATTDFSASKPTLAETSLYFNEPALTTLTTVLFSLSHFVIAESILPPLINDCTLLSKLPTLRVQEALTITMKRPNANKNTLRNSTK